MIKPTVKLAASFCDTIYSSKMIENAFGWSSKWLLCLSDQSRLLIYEFKHPGMYMCSPEGLRHLSAWVLPRESQCAPKSWAHAYHYLRGTLVIKRPRSRDICVLNTCHSTLALPKGAYTNRTCVSAKELSPYYGTFSRCTSRRNDD